MRVQRQREFGRGRAWRWCARGVAVAVVFGSGAKGIASNKSKPPVPIASVSLEDLGFPGVSQSFLASGTSVLTINFVDSEHLLVTYATRGLLQRLPDEPADLQAREVAAELVELPSGKILARTRWRLHDHGRYLWNLGDGRFLLRNGADLSTLAPLANLKAPDAFMRTAFAHRAGAVLQVVTAPDNKLLTVETSTEPPQQQAPPAPQRPSFANSQAPAVTATAAALNKPPPEKGPAVMLDFYRVSGLGTPDSSIVFASAGTVRSPQPVVLPLDADGYLDAKEPERGSQWPVTFMGYDGAKVALAPVDSSCPPGLRLAGPSLVLAVSCRGSIGGEMLMALDFARHEMWEEPLSSSPVPPVFVYAPAVARFAMGRIDSDVPPSDLQLAPDANARQEVKVYQAQTGDLLLKISPTPVFWTSENFDLSADGMRLAVVREGAIEIYKLPELTSSDRSDLAVIAKLAPPPGSGPVTLAHLEGPVHAAAVPAPAGESAPPAEASGPVNGDTEQRRKPPTLLAPGEKPE